MACNTNLATGRTLVVRYALEDCEQSPLTINSWLPIGLIDNQSESLAQRNTTANVDTQSTTLTEATGADATISLATLDAPDITAEQNQQALIAFQRTNLMAKPPRTPKFWVEIIDSHLNQRRFYYVTTGDTERSSEVEGNRTLSFNFTMIPTSVENNPEYQETAIS